MVRCEMLRIMWQGLRDANPFNVFLSDIQAHFNRWAFFIAHYSYACLPLYIHSALVLKAHHKTNKSAGFIGIC